MPIACRELREVTTQLDRLRRAGSQSAREVEQLAIRLGRQKYPDARRPTYVSTILPELPPLNIPSHDEDLRPATAKCIFDQLDDDIVSLNEICEEDEPQQG